jgi:hypothetical protein
MALHASVRSRDIGDVRLIDLIVAVSAVETELAYVETVVVRDRLGWLVANSDVLRRHIIGDAGEKRSHEDEDENNDLQWQRVRPLWKHFRHSGKRLAVPVRERAVKQIANPLDSPSEGLGAAL